jgi:acyl carrier protein
MDRDEWMREEQNREQHRQSFWHDERQRENVAYERQLAETREDELQRLSHDIDEGTRKLRDGETVAGLSQLVGPDAALHYLGTLAALRRVDPVMDRVRHVVAEYLGVDAELVTDAADFSGDLGVDSLDAVEIIMALEEAFDVEIADDEVDGIRTVGDVRAKVEARLRAAAGAP